jgi:hypothetical protein
MSSVVEARSGASETLKYSLSCHVYWVIASQHTKVVTDLVRFTLSQRGQLAAEATGYYPLHPAERTQALAKAKELRP